MNATWLIGLDALPDPWATVLESAGFDRGVRGPSPLPERRPSHEDVSLVVLGPRESVPATWDPAAPVLALHSEARPENLGPVTHGESLIETVIDADLDERVRAAAALARWDTRTRFRRALELIHPLEEVCNGPLALSCQDCIERLGHLLGADQAALFVHEVLDAHWVPRLAATSAFTGLDLLQGNGVPATETQDRSGVDEAADSPIPTWFLPLGAGIRGWLALQPNVADSGLAHEVAAALGRSIARRRKAQSMAIPGPPPFTREQIHERLACLAQLAGGIAHEINNPLFVVTGNLELTRRLAASNVIVTVDKALRAAERIRRVTQDLKEFFAPSTTSMRPVSIDIEALIASTLQIVSVQQQFAGIQVEHDPIDDLPRVTGDDNQLLQVFTQLFVNAAQAMPSGGTLTVKCSTEDSWVIVEVADTGVGIPPDDLGKIFDPFFTTKQDWLGTGLGLSVSHSIVHNHGGRLDASSLQGQGTTMRLMLPASPPGTLSENS